MGGSTKQLRQERHILIREKTEVDDDFDRTVISSRATYALTLIGRPGHISEEKNVRIQRIQRK